MDRTEISVYGQQEQSAYNKHHESTCNHPLLLFNSEGDCVGAKLRPRIESLRTKEEGVVSGASTRNSLDRRQLPNATTSLLLLFGGAFVACGYWSRVVNFEWGGTQKGDFRARLMGYDNATYSSRWFVKRLSHQSRFTCALELLDLRREDIFLDFGAGDGHLVGMAYERQPQANYSLLEIDFNIDVIRKNLAHLPVLRIYKKAADIPLSTFSKISCLEVLEHVTVNSLPSVLRNIYDLLLPGGVLVVSVPIELGPASLFKNVFRFATGLTHPGMNTKAVSLSAVGLARKGPREEGLLGFDYRVVRNLLLQTGFKLERTRFTPFSIGGPLCNSQVHFRLQRPSTTDLPPEKLPLGS